MLWGGGESMFSHWFRGCFSPVQHFHYVKKTCFDTSSDAIFLIGDSSKPEKIWGLINSAIKVERRHVWEGCIHNVRPRSLIFDKWKKKKRFWRVCLIKFDIQSKSLFCVMLRTESGWCCLFALAGREKWPCGIKPQWVQLPVWQIVQNVPERVLQ